MSWLNYMLVKLTKKNIYVKFSKCMLTYVNIFDNKSCEMTCSYKTKGNTCLATVGVVLWRKQMAIQLPLC